MNEQPTQQPPSNPFAHSWVGTTLTVASLVSLQFLFMLLPLVGKAGQHPDREYAVRGMTSIPGAHGFDSYVAQNRMAFLACLFVTLVLAVSALFSRLARRKASGTPVGRTPAIVCGLCVFLLVAHVTGYLSI